MTTGVIIESLPMLGEIRLRALRRDDSGEITISTETARMLIKNLTEAIEFLEDGVSLRASMPDGASPF